MASFVLDERIDDGGRVVATTLDLVDGGLHLCDGAGVSATIPVTYLDAVMRRYGRPLDDGVTAAGPVLELGGGRRLRALRFRAAVDVDVRDYAVYEVDGAEPVAALGRDVAAALVHLARAARALQ